MAGRSAVYQNQTVNQGVHFTLRMVHELSPIQLRRPYVGTHSPNDGDKSINSVCLFLCLLVLITSLRTQFVRGTPRLDKSLNLFPKLFTPYTINERVQYSIHVVHRVEPELHSRKKPIVYSNHGVKCHRRNPA